MQGFTLYDPRPSTDPNMIRQYDIDAHSESDARLMADEDDGRTGRWLSNASVRCTHGEHSKDTPRQVLSKMTYADMEDLQPA